MCIIHEAAPSELPGPTPEKEHVGLSRATSVGTSIVTNMMVPRSAHSNSILYIYIYILTCTFVFFYMYAHINIDTYTCNTVSHTSWRVDHEGRSEPLQQGTRRLPTDSGNVLLQARSAFSQTSGRIQKVEPPKSLILI